MIDNSSGSIIGSSWYYDWSPDTQEIAIGYTFLNCDHWSNGSNSEMKTLMLEHIVPTVRVVWFHIGKENIRSRRAVEKLRAVYSHEENRELEGKPFVQVYYKLDIGEAMKNTSLVTPTKV